MAWCRAYHRTPAAALEQALYDHLGGFDPASDSLTTRIEHVIAEQIDVEQERVLLLVGTLLVQRGEGELWRVIYSVVTDDPTVDGPWRFLERNTAAARRRDI
jgi:hypothetical protein